MGKILTLDPKLDTSDQSISMSALGLPNGATIDPVTGEVTLAPLSSQKGVMQLKAMASDGVSATLGIPYSLIVSNDDTMSNGGILTQDQISALIQSDQLITGSTPYVPGQVYHGLTPIGFDASLAPSYMGITTNSILSDIKAISTRFFGRSTSRRRFTIGGGDTIIAQTNEVFNIPDNVFVLSHPLPVYMNLGLTCVIYPLLPGHSGPAKIQITNPTKNRVYLYPNEGIISLHFLSIALDAGQQLDPYPDGYLDNGELKVRSVSA